MKPAKLLVCIVLLALMAPVAQADWYPGDGHKMHYPQLPDPQGWDVRATFPVLLADSWQCSQTGPVSDIHIWGSWRDDHQGNIENVSVMILGNLPADPYDTVLQANQILWQRPFTPNEFTMLDYGDGQQGWYNPMTGEALSNDHSLFHQINIDNIAEPFVQQQGEIYWLGVIVEVEPNGGAEWGWKTSLSDHFGPDAIWLEAANGGYLRRLLDPSGQPLDLAFVITPEPATLAVLLVGCLARTRRRH